MPDASSPFDRAALWLVSVVGVGFLISLAATWAAAGWPLVILHIAGIAIVLLTAPGALLSRDRFGPTPRAAPWPWSSSSPT
ncbi:MAG: hypothetical protein ACK5KO_03105 [Arachnia sp.]